MPDDWHRHHAPLPAGVVDAHLDDRSLTEPATNADFKHLSDCPYCTSRVAQANASRAHAAPDVSDLDAFERAIAARAPRNGPAVIAAALPAAVAAVVQAAADRPDVAPAQLWRLSWQNATTLVVVISTDDTTAVVAPATPDVDLADRHTLVVPGSGNGLDGPWAVWLALANPVPLFVFDRYYAHLTLPGENRGVAHTARDVIASYKTGDPIDAVGTAPVGTASSSELSVVALADSLREQLSVFADALPDQQPMTLSAAELKRALDDLPPERLADTGLRRGDLVRVVRGIEGLSEQQAQALAPVLGFGVDQLISIGADVPDGLIKEANRVEWRAARELWASQGHIDLAEAPFRLAKSAYELAARTENHSSGSRWRALVQYALQDQLMQLSSES